MTSYSFYFQILKDHVDTPMSSIYGSIHLLRLFGEYGFISLISITVTRNNKCLKSILNSTDYRLQYKNQLQSLGLF